MRTAAHLARRGTALGQQGNYGDAVGDYRLAVTLTDLGDASLVADLRRVMGLSGPAPAGAPSTGSFRCRAPYSLRPSVPAPLPFAFIFIHFYEPSDDDSVTWNRTVDTTAEIIPNATFYCTGR